MEIIMLMKTMFGRLAAISGLLIALVPMSAEAAQGHLDCRASAVRLNLPLGQVVEPLVANAPENPCATDSQSISSFQDLLGLGVSTGTLFASTNANSLPNYAHTKVDGLSLVNLLGLVDLKAKAIRASAKIAAGAHGKCRLNAGSTIAGLSVLGQNFASLRTPLDFDVKLLGIVVAKLHLNATLGGPHPTMGNPNPNKVTQRAVWLQVTDPLLQATLADLIVGEASANQIGNVSCS